MRHRFSRPVSFYTYKRSRHPCDRNPMWLQEYIDTIQYYLRATSRRNHDEPFNKLLRGQRRRQTRRFVLTQRNQLLEG